MECSSFLLGPYLNVALSLSGLFFKSSFSFLCQIYFFLCGLFGFPLCLPPTAPPFFLLVFFFLSSEIFLIKFFCLSYLCAGCIIAICIITVVCAFVPGMVCYSCKTLLLIDMKIKFDYVGWNLKLCKQNHSVTLQFWVRNRRFVLVCCQRMKLVTFCACVVVIFILIIHRDISTLAHSSIFQSVKCSHFFSFISKVYFFIVQKVPVKFRWCMFSKVISWNTFHLLLVCVSSLVQGMP